MAKVNEYKEIIKFLCSDSSSYMTGQNIIIDGAELLSGAKIIFFMKKQNLLTKKLINDHFNLKGLLIQNSEKITQIAKEISLTIKHKGCVFWCSNREIT